jgi:Na+-transporting NADH:ubiquinone oxidoreductase subunit F
MIGMVLGTLLLTGLLMVLALAALAARAILLPRKPVTVSLNDGSRFETMTGERLLGVLSDQGILIPSACAGAGTCGLCRVRITQGGTDALPTEAGRLSRADLSAGTRLACQVVLRNDVTVEVPEDLLGAESLDCTIHSTRFLSPLIREVVIQLPDGHRPEIAAGTFFQVTSPPFTLGFDQIEVPPEFAANWSPLRALSAASSAPVTRAYSIANRPDETAAGQIVLNIRLALPPPSKSGVPPGLASSWLFSVNSGDQIAVSGPFGNFRVQDTRREMVFIGGGVGMAPLRAMIHEQLNKVKTSRKISYWYGARSKTELFYDEEFDALAKAHANFDWTVVLSDPAPTDDWSGATGFVHAVVWDAYLRDHPAPEDCEYYLCGPPLMIRAVLTMLEDAGVPRDNIFSDDFGV